MKYLESIWTLLNESVESYEFKLESEDPLIYKYSFIDAVGNNYLVEFKNRGSQRPGTLSNIYELVYFVEDSGNYSVSKIVNVNPYRVFKTVLGDILNDFIKRCSWAKTIYFIGLAKEKEKEYISSRTKVYLRYLKMNPVPGFRLSSVGNEIKLIKT